VAEAVSRNEAGDGGAVARHGPAVYPGFHRRSRETPRPADLLVLRFTPMRHAAQLLLAILLGAGPVAGQEVASRAWQQRLALQVPLPVPLLELAPIDPFASPIDVAPVRREATPPRKLQVKGTARVAAYVDARGNCTATVPLEQPFSGLTSALAAGLATARFEPGQAGKQPMPSWVVVEVTILGTVKESSVAAERLELPDPGRAPEVASPTRLSPSGQSASLPATPASALTAIASLRKLRVKAPARELETPVRALVRVSPAGRCDGYVPLELEGGLAGWLESYLGSWRLEPAQRNGEPVPSWMLYSARVRLSLSALSSVSARVLPGETYSPSE
jgi:hypothetical protein